MNARPVLRRQPVRLPAFPGSANIWATLIELASTSQPEWTLVGGQMVMLHAAEHAAPPLRVSRDIDVVVNARVVTGALRRFVAGIERRGFQLEGASPDGVAHRYSREGVGIDVLAPEGLGRRADLTTTPPGRTIQAPGGTQALARTALVPVEHAGEQGLIPRPSLLGAIVCREGGCRVSGRRAGGTTTRSRPTAEPRNRSSHDGSTHDPQGPTASSPRGDRRHPPPGMGGT